MIDSFLVPANFDLSRDLILYPESDIDQDIIHNLFGSNMFIYYRAIMLVLHYYGDLFDDRSKLGPHHRVGRGCDDLKHI